MYLDVTKENMKGGHPVKIQAIMEQYQDNVSLISC